ncbi:malic enzyme-like protein [Streptomyces sp. SID13666]|uniref:malic enzyme-like protein n=1 Tax=unclassified Streptomyces TaxID=2593676 RepID=UPI0013C16CBB|nr:MULTISPECIES: malic enzyme-like protein [unclassified Streptomyces]MCZ4101537.1 malic enzyme-like protein [Streptomyces sp. H39-C1]NEA54721.1 malic enzyme-like protein [Streptomyces sp. SID13666]NEA70510.1 malic enzyme-like protein [Streptomyces sp. SID13588]
MTQPPARTRPEYGLEVTFRCPAFSTVAAILAVTAGAALVAEDIHPDTGAQRVMVDTDGPQTLHRLRNLLRDRLGDDLIHLADPVFEAAATGKTTQRLCVPAASERDRALLDSTADRRVIEHLLLQRGDVDRYTGRGRRIALLSNASAVAGLGPLPVTCVLPALESAAVHLRRATGLDIHPLPVAADTPGALATIATALAPGFAVLCLIHTHPLYAHAVRAALEGSSTPVVDAVCHAHAVATAAAALNALDRKGIPLDTARVVLSGPEAGCELSGLLLSAGIRDLTIDTSGSPITPFPADLVVDLFGLPAPRDGTPVLRACPQELPPLHASTQQPHPFHALPALLTVAARTRHLGPHGLVSAVRALAARAPAGGLLPPVGQAGLVQALTLALLPGSSHPTDV